MRALGDSLRFGFSPLELLRRSPRVRAFDRSGSAGCARRAPPRRQSCVPGGSFHLRELREIAVVSDSLLEFEPLADRFPLEVVRVADDMRRQEDEQIRLAKRLGLGLEEPAEEGNVAQEGDARSLSV